MTVAELKTAALELSEEEMQEFLRSVLEEMPVVRLNALVKHLEEVWDVSAAGAPVMMAGMPGAAAGGDEAGGEAPEQTEFDVILKEIGDSKLNVIKVVREIASVGIKEAKALVDEIPKAIVEKVTKAEAEDYVKQLTEAGAVAEMK